MLGKPESQSVDPRRTVSGHYVKRAPPPLTPLPPTHVIFILVLPVRMYVCFRSSARIQRLNSLTRKKQRGKRNSVNFTAMLLCSLP